MIPEMPAATPQVPSAPSDMLVPGGRFGSNVFTRM
jgi:hypothetical protein